MKFCKISTLFISVTYLAAVFSFPLVNTLDGLNDGYVDVKLTNTSFVKRQSQQELSSIIGSIDGVADNIANSDPRPSRGQFTGDFVTAMWQRDGNYNYIICFAEVDHDYNFQGAPGVDWGHYKTQAYLGSRWWLFDVVVGRAGSFIRHGDGGFINWAYIGDVVSRVDIGDDSFVTFNAP